LETGVQSQASDWLVAISANQMLEILDWSPISVLFWALLKGALCCCCFFSIIIHKMSSH
jgi:hypothetical protein